MTYQTVPYDFIGGYYKHRSLPLSAQTTKNMIPEVVPSGKTPTALNIFPGLKTWYSGSGTDRGMHVMNGILYKVSGNTLYKVTSDTTHTSLGTVSGSGQCQISDDGTNLIISIGTARYIYNGSTLSTITDSDHQAGYSSAYINRQFVYDGNGNNWEVSDVGAPSSINGLNIAVAETSTTSLVRVYTKDQNTYLFTGNSIEPWWNNGTGNPPFQRINQSVRNVGLVSPYAVCDTKAFIYFLSTDGSVYRYRSFIEESVTPPAVVKEFRSYALTDAKFQRIYLDDMEVVVAIWPTSGKTWAYIEQADSWIELTDTNLETRHPINSYVYCYNKHLVSDYSNGNIYELDFDTFDNNGNTIIRERTGKPFDSNIIQKPGRRLVMRSMRFEVETGVGLATGQGVNPYLLCSASYDGGKSFTNEDSVELYRTGEGKYEAIWYNKAEFYSMVPRIRLSDPVRLAVYGASIDVKLGGRR